METGYRRSWRRRLEISYGLDQCHFQRDPSLLTSTIDASIESHVMGFMAEESRKTKKKVMGAKL